MQPERQFTSDPARFPRVEACANLFFESAELLATVHEQPAATNLIFHAQRAGLELGLLIARMEPAWGEALLEELRVVAEEPQALGDSAPSYRVSLLAEVTLLLQLAEAIASGQPRHEDRD